MISDPIIRIENLSKIYRVDGNRCQTIREVAQRIFQSGTDSKRDPIVALKNINLEIDSGEQIGIIGDNGAGKSTLLKILAKIVRPTLGVAKVRARVVGLLEVGAGFSNELTGLENIFLSGAIYGMHRSEIKARLEEIIEFSEIGTFIDLPVKTYSSGMYMRLAFAVAAHLDGEILLVDEVLSVGDIRFQEKCLNKMNVEVNRGRTILFVSHSLSALSAFCKSGIVLRSGEIKYKGPIQNAIQEYLRRSTEEVVVWSGDEGDENIRLLETWVRPVGSPPVWTTTSSLEIGCRIEVKKSSKAYVVGANLISEYGDYLAYFTESDLGLTSQEFPVGPAVRRFIIPPNSLAAGTYRIEFDLGIHQIKRIIRTQGALSFKLENVKGLGQAFFISGGRGYTSLFRPEWFKREHS